MIGIKVPHDTRETTMFLQHLKYGHGLPPNGLYMQIIHGAGKKESKRTKSPQVK
jgi:hypothetical protein